LHLSSASLNIEIDEELGMFTTRPPHGYSPQLLSELGTAELFVLSSLRLWFLSHCDRDHEYPDLGEAEAELLEWCPPTAVRLALEAAHVLAAALHSHSLLIPVREPETLRSNVSTVPVAARSVLLH
jgi:hypothetical protein